MNAQFSIEAEQLAFPIRSTIGEVDSFIIYPDPDKNILGKLRTCKTRIELWNDLTNWIIWDSFRMLPLYLV